jgi:hypothetical protein
MGYAQQDLRCNKCRRSAPGMLSLHCVCSGTFELSVAPKAVRTLSTQSSHTKAPCRAQSTKAYRLASSLHLLRPSKFFNLGLGTDVSSARQLRERLETLLGLSSFYGLQWLRQVCSHCTCIASSSVQHLVPFRSDEHWYLLCFGYGYPALLSSNPNHLGSKATKKAVVCRVYNHCCYCFTKRGTSRPQMHSLQHSPSLACFESPFYP